MQLDHSPGPKATIGTEGGTNEGAAAAGAESDLGTIPPSLELGARCLGSSFLGAGGGVGEAAGGAGSFGASLGVGLFFCRETELTWIFLLGFGATGGGILDFFADVFEAKLITELKTSLTSS